MSWNNASGESIIQISVILCYLIVCSIAYIKLIRHLTPASKRLAAVFLAAQIVIIILSGITRSATGYVFWLWRLNTEWNVPATLASMQLALVGFTALISAWKIAGDSRWLRTYLIGIGAVFLFLAYDEYAMIHESIWNWPMYYAVLGIGIAFASLVAAVKSNHENRKWYFFMVLGLAIATIGAVLFEEDFWECGIGIYSRFGICIERNNPLYEVLYVLEESLEFLGIWLALVTVLGIYSVKTTFSARRLYWLLYAWPLFWLAFLVQSNVITPLSERSTAIGATVEYEAGEHLHGYIINSSDHDLRLHLYMSSRNWDFDRLGYSIHLIDQATLATIAQINQVTDIHLEFWIGPGYVPIHRQYSNLLIPEDAPRNRALWVILTLWHEQGQSFNRQTIQSSDLPLLSDKQVILDEIVLQSEAHDQLSAPLAVFDKHIELTDINLPDFALSDSNLEVTFTWRAKSSIQDNLIQFLHLCREASGDCFVHDQHPLGVRLPTRLWYDGLYDSEVWQVPIPSDLREGEYAVFTGLYSEKNNARANARRGGGAKFSIPEFL